jgi:hypothetical protein
MTTNTNTEVQKACKHLNIPRCIENPKQKDQPFVFVPFYYQCKGLVVNDTLGSVVMYAPPQYSYDDLRVDFDKKATTLKSIERYKKAGIDPQAKRICPLCGVEHLEVMFAIPKLKGRYNYICKVCWHLGMEHASTAQKKLTEYNNSLLSPEELEKVQNLRQSNVDRNIKYKIHAI